MSRVSSFFIQINNYLKKLNSAKQSSEVIVSECSSVSRPPLWFCYTGMGAHWAGMGLTLLKESAHFKNSLEKCHQILKSSTTDFDLFAILNEQKFDTVLKSMVSNVCIQIALTDLLCDQFGIVPDNIFGHSSGEIVCAYAAKVQTLEETLMATYWRAKVILDSQKSGKMKRGNVLRLNILYVIYSNQEWSG